MFIPFRLSAASAIVATLLAACAGGGGGGSVSVPLTPAAVTRADPVTVPFTSFSAIDPDLNQRVVMSGISQTGTGSGNIFNVDTNAEAASIVLPYAKGRYLTGLGFETPKSSLSFGSTPGDWGTCSGVGCTFGNASQTSSATLLNPAGYGWDYQSFGVWMSNPSVSTFQAGAISAGAATPASALPLLGTANFAGQAGGYYFDGNGGKSATDAQMKAAVNFGTRTIDFQTMGTMVNGTVPKDGLNLSGTLNYASGVNQFSGAVVTQDKSLSGSATGRFYGPNAQEIGGTYGVGSPGGAGMVGGFGGKKQ